MLDRNDLLDLTFYKMSPFKGSLGKLRYKIEKITDDDGTYKLLVTTWPGPFNFEKTDDSLKEKHTEEFSEEGMQKITDYLNKNAEKMNA
jgi:hypothetical protein